MSDYAVLQRQWRHEASPNPEDGTSSFIRQRNGSKKGQCVHVHGIESLLRKFGYNSALLMALYEEEVEFTGLEGYEGKYNRCWGEFVGLKVGIPPIRKKMILNRTAVLRIMKITRKGRK
jgi:hypothetical protein